MSDPQDIQVDAAQEIPGTLPVLPLRDTVVFPDTMIPLTIGQERSIKLIDDVLAGDRLLTLVTSKDAEIEVPGPELLHPIGTVGLAHKMIKLPDGTMRILVQGLQRVHVDKYVQEEPYLAAEITTVEDVLGETNAQEDEITELRQKVDELKLPEEADKAARRELDRLANVSPQSAEYPVILSLIHISEPTRLG